MVKRILDATASDFRAMSPQELEESIRKAEGRTIACECVSSIPPLVDGVTNAEVVAAMGADIIILNVYDVDNPVIFGLPGANTLPIWNTNPVDFFRASAGATIHDLKQLVGQPIGIVLESSDITDASYQGRKATVANARKAREQGADIVYITGNPGAGTTNRGIIEAVDAIHTQMDGELFIVAGKIHGAGVVAEQGSMLMTADDVKAICRAGAHAVAMPMPGAISGWTVTHAHALADVAHEEGSLSWMVLDHGIEGAQREAIIQFSVNASMAGADVLEIGDSGLGGIALPENVMEMSLVVRGRRHTYRRMAMSIHR
jgi:hypothetical protein